MTITRYSFAASFGRTTAAIQDAPTYCTSDDVADLEARHRETLDALAQSQAECRTVRKYLEATEKLIDPGLHIQVGALEMRNAALMRRIAELEAAQRWIPCSEREPDADGRYAILYATKDRPDRLRQFTGDYLVNGPGPGWGSIVDNDMITHWMALPPAPKETL